MGRLDRERYEREKAVYKGPWKVPDVKDPNEPKKPMSPFLAFANERRRAVANANPLWTGSEISSFLSKLWKECPPEVKKTYQDRVAREREQFKREHAKWERQKELSQSSERESSSMSDHSTAAESDHDVETESFAPESQPTSIEEQALASALMRMQQPGNDNTSNTGGSGGGIPALPTSFDPSSHFGGPSSSSIVMQPTASATAGSSYLSQFFPSNSQTSATTCTAMSDNSKDQVLPMPTSMMVNHLSRHDFTMPPLPLAGEITTPTSNPLNMTASNPSVDFAFNMAQQRIIMNAAAAAAAAQNTTTPRFENYSMEDILQSEELFEDFSPTSVPGGSNNNNNRRGGGATAAPAAAAPKDGALAMYRMRFS